MLPSTPAYMRAPARARGGSTVSFLLQPIYDVTCDFPFFDPLEAEFEKVVFTKVVALAMLYLVVFENLKKVNFYAFYGNFRSFIKQM